jgi:predicted dehydrogenase
MNQKKPTFGIVGCGNISRFHFNGLIKAGVDIAHVVDLDEKAAQPYVKEFGATFSKDYKDILNNNDITVMSVLTTGKTHLQMCLDGLAAGKDIVCEKTLADNTDEAEQIVRAVKTSDQLFFVSYMKRFFPAYKKALELIPSLGHIFHAQVRTFQPWGDFYETTELGDWDFVFPSYGGAIMKCAGSHMLDAFMGLLGRPDSVFAHVDYVENTLFDRKATALFGYDNGLTVNFEAAAHPLKKIGYEKNSWDEYIEISGTQGRLRFSTVTWDQPENNPAMLEFYDNQSQTSTEYRFDAVNPFNIEMEDIVQSLVNREQINPNVVDGFNVDVVIDTMKESHETKKSLKIDWRGIK